MRYFFGNFDAGDVWLWAAIDADTKLVPCWLVGPRTPQAARDFIEDLAGRLTNRVQLTTDGLKMYVRAVGKAFADDVDYAMLVKIYGIPNDGEKRYSPAKCLGCESHVVTGTPDPKYISTSYVERHNLSVRMTPAMAAGATDRLWEVSDLVALLESEERGLERAA